MGLLVTSLSLADFRSFELLSLSPAPTTTILVGPNAAGKTNTVEALQLLDILTYAPVNRLAPDELARLKEFASKVDRQKVVECAKRYPGKTALRLLESEANGVLA